MTHPLRCMNYPRAEDHAIQAKLCLADIFTNNAVTILYSLYTIARVSWDFTTKIILFLNITNGILIGKGVL